MREYDVVCNFTGEVLYTSALVYLCDKFIHEHSLAGVADIYQCRKTIPSIPEYTSMYFELQMIALLLQA